ncbi:hypothetical protein WJX73_003785 [Symbiochloris irregularis]|uniref:ABC1 atypical kinase-like domain-containing protein n=1 Tax=Symbiochloris irregularis TaxID=706552 RepID=A0AAW1NSC3_9CHLO
MAACDHPGAHIRLLTTSAGTPAAASPGKGLLVAASLLAGSAGALAWASDGDSANATSLLSVVPRSLWACGWSAHTAWDYRQCMLLHQGTEGYDEALDAVHEACAARLLRLCSSNGGVYIKAAQLISTAQSVPVQYRRQLEKLQDRVPPRSLNAVAKVIQKELGMPISQAFSDFEEQSRAAASLAQVHKAWLHDGREVAVKVQYPGLQAAVTSDLTALAGLSALGAFLFPDSFDFGWVFKELKGSLAKELDFTQEASNAAGLAQRMQHQPYITVPAPVGQLSTSRVLVMEWIEGCKVNDAQALLAAKLWPREVALLLLHAFGEMVFVQGAIHGDPHPGNIIVRPRPNGTGRLARWLRGGWLRPQLVLIDHGIYTSLPERLRAAYCQLWCSFVVNDMRTATAIARDIAGEQGAEILPKLLKPGALQQMPQEERARLRERLGISSPADLGRLLQMLPRELVDVMRVNSVVRGIAASLGATVHDRLRINATYALKGMAWGREGETPVQDKDTIMAQ